MGRKDSRRESEVEYHVEGMSTLSFLRSSLSFLAHLSLSPLGSVACRSCETTELLFLLNLLEFPTGIRVLQTVLSSSLTESCSAPPPLT